MQPYFLPYIGYFQLINAVDEFVFLDDVNYINRGWINRNRILLYGSDYLFSIPCKKVSQNKLINEVELGDVKIFYDKFKQTLKLAYSKAPYYQNVINVIEEIFNSDVKRISDLAKLSIKYILNYLDLKKIFKSSSDDFSDHGFKGYEKLIDICKQAGIYNYINPSGGNELYSKIQFESKGIALYFLIPEEIKYEQYKNNFVPWLSIIDVLMFNSPKTIKTDFLNKYRLE